MNRLSAIERLKARVNAAYTNHPLSVRRVVIDSQEAMLERTGRGCYLMTIWFKHEQDAEAFAERIRRTTQKPHGRVEGFVYKVEFDYEVKS